MACGCTKIGKMKGKAITVTMEDALWIGAGILGGMAINGSINKMSETWDPKTKQWIPYGKVGLGAGTAFVWGKKWDKKIRLASLGFAGIGLVEAAQKIKPDVFTISGYGVDGDLYDEISGGYDGDYETLELGAAGGAKMYEDHPADTHLVMGLSAADVV